MSQPRVSRTLIDRVPFFYGWVVLISVCFAGFSRQGPAVATLSVFVTPMTTEFGWSRTAISGAVSLGGVLAALLSPAIGTYLDRAGARAVLCFAVLSTAATTMLLPLTESIVIFYFLFCLARMNFAGPYDLGIYGAVNNWFIRRRGFATAVVNLAQMAGLVAMPIIAQIAIIYSNWRGGWLAIGLTVLLVGFLPVWFFMIRRPEDVGLQPDGDFSGPHDPNISKQEPQQATEPTFNRKQAISTPAFWLLSIFTILVYPVQAGVSLHQAPHLIECGIDPTVAATVVSTFSCVSAIVGFSLGFWPSKFPLHIVLAATGVALGTSALMMLDIASPIDAYVASAVFGLGIGGLLTTLPLAWANYFGRKNFGSIRGVALTMQVLAQASGPLISGVLRDLTGTYDLSLTFFSILAFCGATAGIVARPPKIRT